MGIVVSNSRNVTNVVFNFFISQRFYSLVFNSILYSENAGTAQILLILLLKKTKSDFLLCRMQYFCAHCI